MALGLGRFSAHGFLSGAQRRGFAEALESAPVPPATLGASPGLQMGGGGRREGPGNPRGLRAGLRAGSVRMLGPGLWEQRRGVQREPAPRPRPRAHRRDCVRSRPGAGPQCSPAGPRPRMGEPGEGGRGDRAFRDDPPTPGKMQTPGLLGSADPFSVSVVLWLWGQCIPLPSRQPASGFMAEPAGK